MGVDKDKLKIVEIQYDTGEVHFRFSTCLSSDGERWIRHGLYCEYSPSGKVISEGMFEEGLEQGLWRDFYENGQLAAEGAYKNGKMHGVWHYWNEEGAQELDEEYVEGNLV